MGPHGPPGFAARPTDGRAGARRKKWPMGPLGKLRKKLRTNQACSINSYKSITGLGNTKKYGGRLVRTMGDVQTVNGFLHRTHGSKSRKNKSASQKMFWHHLAFSGTESKSNFLKPDPPIPVLRGMF